MKQSILHVVLPFVLSICMVFSLVGCALQSEDRAATTALGSEFTPITTATVSNDAICVDLMADISPSVTPNINAFTQSEKTTLSDFSMRLLISSHSDGKNLLISPLSVLSALSMTSNGAMGETLQEFETMFGMPVEELNSCMAWYLSHLPQSDDYRLLPANSIWFTNGKAFVPNSNFLDTNAAYYGADAFMLPFNDDACNKINEWCSEKTDGMIPELIDEIPPETVMYLINALSFEAEWLIPYRENQLRDDVFTREDGTQEKARFLCADEGEYLSDENATGFIKYYRDKQYAFVALLPNEGVSLRDYLNTLNGERFQKLLVGRETTAVQTMIPKFEVSCGIELSEVLKGMGIPLAFDADLADLSGIGTADGNLYINRVLHKSFISLTEQGTKAGAATAVEINTKGIHMVQKEVLLNRPFIYFLIDCETNLPFFAGTFEQIQP